MATRANYHHGDLRRTLLDASLAFINEQGVEALSLREVARKAGVSHNAPYHHFPDKKALLTAIAEEGFVELARDMGVARARLGDDDLLERLAACGNAYVTFALRSPAHFRVMYRCDLIGAEDGVPSPLVAASEPAFAMLVKSVTECQAAGLIPAGDPMPFVLTCWSAVHGLAALWLDGPLSQDAKGFGKSPERLTTMVVGTIMGLLTAASSPKGKVPPSPVKRAPAHAKRAATRALSQDGRRFIRRRPNGAEG